MEEEKTNTEDTNTESSGSESTGSESTGSESTAAETPAETATETATAPEPAPAAEETPAADAGGDDAGEKKRPVFLTILCILTFVGSGLGVLFGLLGIIGASFMGSLMDSIPGMGAAMGGTTAYIGVGVALAAASLYGAIMMWKLKKTGFYIYTGANIIGAILPIVWLGVGFAFMSFLWPVVFIVLYALNLKHLS